MKTADKAFLKSFGDNLRAARYQSKMTQEELAKHTGVKRELISKYEMGDCCPSVETGKKLADALSIDINDLFIARYKWELTPIEPAAQRTN